MADIKDVIRDFVNFDVENNYYQEDQKDELVRMFKEILFEDETTVRQFLKSFMENAKSLASQYSLVAGEGEALAEPIAGAAEVEEIEPEETEDAEEVEDAEEMEDAEELEDAVEESAIARYRKAASNILYE